jgi:ElaB/YqjD/DUF883 family membrane-anchored ribosome-binding protein
MATNNEMLPEGTDTIIAGASGSEPPTGAAAPSSRRSAAAKKIEEKASDLKSQATDKARELAVQGKDKTVGALDNVVKLVEEAAGTIDEKVGTQYGAYARRASESVAGFASTLRAKDVDELFQDAREAVKKSPAIAIGAAAAVGFLLARVIKSASSPADDGSKGDGPKGPAA